MQGPEQQKKAITANRYPPWAPRFWGGMRLPEYLGLLTRNRFRTHITKYPMMGLVGMCSVFNSGLSALQRMLFHRKIMKTELVAPPIFIIGHWRSGTTLMHELMALDETRTYPNNFQAFMPHHFLVSRFFLYPLISMLMPRRRPMDNMALSPAAPQEDDFALISLGAPTPYSRIAFPHNRTNDYLQLNPEIAPATTIEQVGQNLDYFYRALTVRHQKPLVLKSPPHTGRVRQLVRWFPGAKFIHMSRHPYQMVPSTYRLWTLLEQTQSFQKPEDHAALRDYVSACKDLMYDAYWEARDELHANEIVEVQFEKLVSDPESEIRRIHEQLELTGVEDLLPGVRAYFDASRQYQRNQHEIDLEQQAELDRHWERYMQEFGY